MDLAGNKLLSLQITANLCKDISNFFTRIELNLCPKGGLLRTTKPGFYIQVKLSNDPRCANVFVPRDCPFCSSWDKTLGVLKFGYRGAENPYNLTF